MQDYYQALLAEREKIAIGLPLHQQKALDTHSCLPAKRGLVAEKTMEGVYEMHIKYDKYDGGRRGGYGWRLGGWRVSGVTTGM